MADFHFIRPEWLFAIPLVFIIIYLLKRLQISNSGWQQVIPAHLAQKLIDGDNNHKQGFSLVIPAILTLLAIIALAGPAWQKLPQPVYNVQKGAVIIMDMSNSMYATDLSPNRLTRARYKAIDLLEKLNEGDIGLIAYAGDSFIISPLTEDINNIKLLLPALSPQLMPVQGSNPLLALTMANDMLINAGHINGDIYWLTDDVDQYDIKEVTNFVSSINHSINILGIGSKTGAPIKMPDGQLLKDDSGAIVLPHLTEGALSAIAQRGRGAYQTIRNNSDDINALVNNAKAQAELKDEGQQLSEGDQYKEAGPYLLLLMLPLMLGYFRRGNLLAILPCLCFFSNVPESYAQQASPAITGTQQGTTLNESVSETAQSSFWQDLWQTQDQQAQEKYQQEQYDAAAKQFTDPMWQGSAHYKNGNYEQALQAFQQSDSADALYNQGNSLAKLQKLDEAIKAYEQALAKNPDLAAAKANKALLEELKKQQEQQQQNQDQNNDNSDENQQDQQDQQNNQDQEQNQQDQQSNDQQNDNQQQQNDSQSNGEQNQQEQSSEQEQQDEQQNAEQQAEQEPEPESEQETEQESPAEQNEEGENGEEQEPQAAQLTEAEQAAKEEEQKHQQLLKKVTDDPYLLLRNKMQLEYQKRRNQTSGVNKKW